jgi:hypothetical protein
MLEVDNSVLWVRDEAVACSKAGLEVLQGRARGDSVLQGWGRGSGVLWGKDRGQ